MSMAHPNTRSCPEQDENPRTSPPPGPRWPLGPCPPPRPDWADLWCDARAGGSMAQSCASALCGARGRCYVYSQAVYRRGGSSTATPTCGHCSTPTGGRSTGATKPIPPPKRCAPKLPRPTGALRAHSRLKEPEMPNMEPLDHYISRPQPDASEEVHAELDNLARVAMAAGEALTRATAQRGAPEAKAFAAAAAAEMGVAADDSRRRAPQPVRVPVRRRQPSPVHCRQPAWTKRRPRRQRSGSCWTCQSRPQPMWQRPTAQGPPSAPLRAPAWSRN
jgi:hypothetical protein